MAEKKPIIRVFFARLKEAWFEYSEEEKQEYMGKDRENIKELGGRLMAMCDCRWSNDEWQFFGVEEWPNMEAVQKRVKFEDEELESSRFVKRMTFLGSHEPDEYAEVS